MTRRDLVWAAAYGAGFAEELRRLLHGQERTTTRRVSKATKAGGEDVFETVSETIDATADAKRWATACAAAAVASLPPEER